MFWIGLLIGLLGGSFGMVIVLAFCMAAGQADRAAEAVAAKL